MNENVSAVKCDVNIDQSEIGRGIDIIGRMSWTIMPLFLSGIVENDLLVDMSVPLSRPSKP
ncbi:hypothetical protein DSCA_62980 [Desulfosarcina alkanivorans]|jgi:hypothetical protein|uniref:Uncharacterized protein n=1 Tax=Desulfosarcina alkanivorans TaxID=571177 RepID=A0A5K7YUN7_9BACT|nr:hypothetical protein DSCA_62980 [Desulfosarcina alkanivorans]